MAVGTWRVAIGGVAAALILSGCPGMITIVTSEPPGGASGGGTVDARPTAKPTAAPRPDRTPGPNDTPTPPRDTMAPSPVPIAAVSARPAAARPLTDANGAPALERPHGVGFTADGALVVADNSTPDWRVLRIGPDGAVGRVAGGGAALNVEASRADQLGIFEPRAVGVDAAGNVYFASLGGGNASLIHRIGPGGEARVVFRGADGGVDFERFTVAPDGTLFVLGYEKRRPDANGETPSLIDLPWKVVRVTPDGQAKDVVTGLPTGFGNYSIGRGADGAIYVAGLGRLHRWTEANGVAEVAQHAAFNGQFANLVVDARGRLFGATQWSIYRYDLADGRHVELAGRNGTVTTEPVEIPGGLALAPDGALHFSVPNRNQLRRIPADKL